MNIRPAIPDAALPVLFPPPPGHGPGEACPGESSSPGQSSAGESSSSGTSPALEPATPERVVPVIEERLKISRRSVETGHATRVRKVVRERVQDVDLATDRDEVSVERVPIGRLVEGRPEVREEGDVLVIPVVEERLVVRTERVLREEIRITRRRRSTHEIRPVRLRGEVAIVERYDPATRAWVEVEAPACATAVPTVGAVAETVPEPRREASHQAPVELPSIDPPRARTSIMYTVIGAFDDRQSARRTVDALVAQGVPRASIEIQATPDTLDPTASSVPRYETASGATTRREADDDGFFGGVRHFFASLFGTETDDQVGIYSEAVRRGSTIVVVDASDESQAERAAQLMREQGGTIDLDERSTAWRAEGWTGTEHHRGVTGGTAGAMAAQALGDQDRVVHTAAGRERDLGESRRGDRDRFSDRDALAGTDREVVMPVVQEEVRVGKRAVEQGGVRVIRRVSETPVSELVRLRDERARIERRPADRAASAADLENFREDTVEVRERTEEPVVEKVARVVEEVVVGREVDERTERIEDTVRRTDVEIDRLARDADARLERATGDDWVDEEDKVAGGPVPPAGTEPRERSLGEKLKGAAKGKDERRPRP